MTTETRTTTGIDLQIERLRVRPKILAKDVANEMGISSSRLSKIENDEKPVTHNMAERYRDALETCRTFRTEAA